MVFFSLTGWAAIKLDGYSISFSSEEAVAYNAANQMPTITLTKSGEADIAQNKVNVVWKTVDGTPVTEIVNVGEYVVTVTSNSADTYGNLAEPTKHFWILKANNTVSNTGAVSAPESPATSFSYRAAGYDLVATPPTVTFDQAGVKYLATMTSTAPDADAEGWSTTAPHVSKVGTHYVWFKVAGTDNYKAVDPQAVGAGSVTIEGTGWVAGDYTAPAALTATLTFNNTPQALISAGRITNTEKSGTFKYSLDNVTWSTDVPTATDVKAGGYTVYWMIEGGNGFADLAEATQKIEGIIINPATPTINPAPAKSGLVYSGLDQVLVGEGSATLGATPTYTLQYRANSEVEWSLAVAATYADLKGRKAGQYKVTTQVAEGGNYLAASQTTEVTIAKAPLTISTKAATKVYGSDDPTFEANYTGFMNGETAAALAALSPAEFSAPTLTRATGENVGTYKISATANATAENYDITYDADHYQNLTITPKELSTTASEFEWTLAFDSKAYTGEKIMNSVTSAKFKGVTPAQTLNNPDDYTFVCTNNINVGTANVVISGQGNFKGSVVLPYTITGQAIYIQPLDAEKNYSEADPTSFSYKLVDGAGADVTATLNGTVELARVAGENVGSYKIYVVSYTADAANPDNYAPANTFNDPNSELTTNKIAWFTINPSISGDGLKLKFKDGTVATKVYGNANPAWTIDDLEYVSGAIGSDTWETIKPTLSTPDFEIASEDVADNATNKVTVTGLASANYPSVTVTPIAFTITKRPIAVVVENQTVTYGDNVSSDVEKWSVATGYSLATSDTKSAVGITLSTVNSIGTYTPGDTYNDAIQASITGETNYELVTGDCVNGKLTVTAISPTAAIVFDKEAGNMYDKIVAFDGQTRDVTVKLYRKNVVGSNTYTWGRAQWNPMVLPFEVSVRELSTAIGYAIVNTYDELNTTPSNAGFKLTMGTIPANTPFLLKTDADITEGFELKFTGKEIVAPTGDMTLTATNGISFIGTYEDVVIDKNSSQAQGDAETYWKYYAANEIKGISKTSENKYTVYPFGGFFNWTAPSASAPAMTITVQDADGTITSISSIESEDEINASGWYNLNGIKLEGAPTQKGIYIKDGKKFILK